MNEEILKEFTQKFFVEDGSIEVEMFVELEVFLRKALEKKDKQANLT